MTTIDSLQSGNPETPRMQHAMRYALILGAIGIALMLGGHYAKWDTESWSYRVVSWVISIGSIFWMIKDFRDNQNGGFLRIGQGVGLSALTGVFAGIITAIAFYFFLSYLAPNFIENVKNKSIQDMYDAEMSESEIEESVKYMSMFMTSGFFAFSALIGTIISYTILGVIASAIFKRD